MSTVKQMRADRNAYMDMIYATNRVKYAELVSGFRLFAWQVRLLTSRHKRKVLNCARQAGKSSIVSVIPAHTAKFKPRSSCFILAATEQQAGYVMAKIKDCMSRDPTYPEIKRDSDSLIVLENKSRIEVICATEKSARGPSKPNVIIADEASRIEDEVISSGIVPMLNDNPECELIIPSTPNGKAGFFFRVFGDPRWERYYVRSPFTPTGPWELAILKEEALFKAEQAALGLIAYYSPRHMNYDEQLHDQLGMMGRQLYLQENCGEFVEPDAQLLSYDDIQRAFENGGEVQVLRSGLLVRGDIDALDPDPAAE